MVELELSSLVLVRVSVLTAACAYDHLTYSYANGEAWIRPHEESDTLTPFIAEGLDCKSFNTDLLLIRF